MAIVDYTRNEGRKNEVWQRLTHPREVIGFDELAQRWQCLDISVKLSGYGGLVGAPNILPMLRGAIGRALMMGASQESLAQKICPWAPPCTNDVFFGPKPEIKITRHTQVVPKPFVLSAKAQGQDLALTISLFGFAGDWQADIRTALIVSVRENINWQKLAQDIFLPSALDCQIHTQRAIIKNVVPIPNRVVMDFITPVDCKNTDPADNPMSVLSRLANRLYLLARWHGVGIEVDWKALSNAWRALVIGVESENTHTLVRNSKRTSTQYKVSGRCIQLTLEGDLSPLWPLLVMGEQAHIGRGTTAGLGRYKLKSTENSI